MEDCELTSSHWHTKTIIIYRTNLSENDPKTFRTALLQLRIWRKNIHTLRQVGGEEMCSSQDSYPGQVTQKNRGTSQTHKAQGAWIPHWVPQPGGWAMGKWDPYLVLKTNGAYYQKSWRAIGKKKWACTQICWICVPGQRQQIKK